MAVFKLGAERNSSGTFRPVLPTEISLVPRPSLWARDYTEIRIGTLEYSSVYALHAWATRLVQRSQKRELLGAYAFSASTLVVSQFSRGIN